MRLIQTRAILFALFLSVTPTSKGQCQDTLGYSSVETITQFLAEKAAHVAEPVIIFDIDDFLLSTTARQWAVLEEFMASQDVIQKYPGEQNAFYRVTERNLEKFISQNGEQLTFKKLLGFFGINNTAMEADYLKFWVKHFLSGEHLHLDTALAGSAEFVEAIRKRVSKKIIYLTGRDKLSMEEGTSLALKNAGFPLDDNILLLMKEDRSQDDAVFKDSIAEKIRSMGNLIAVFDNEPSNLDVFDKKFPDAALILLDSIRIKEKEIPNRLSFRLKNFLNTN